MTVAVDGRALYDGSEHRGLGKYLWHLLLGLGSVPDMEVRVLAPEGTSLPTGVAMIPVARKYRGRLSLAEHSLRLPTDIGRSGADVFFGPAQHPPSWCGIPWVQTFHDATPLLHPQFSTLRDRLLWRRRRRRFRRADAIVTLSKYSAKQAIEALGVRESMLNVITPGIDKAFQPAAQAQHGPPYVLSVGPWSPHKGLDAAMEVIAQLADAGLSHQLRITGWADAWMRKQLRQQVVLARRPDRVAIVGYVDDLVPLYQGASVVLMTSRAEGFGLPAVEAMACGVPVVAFDNSALTEVVQGAGVLVPDGDVDAMSVAVMEVLRNPARRSTLVASGLKRAQEFAAHDSISRHVDLLRRVAAN